MKSRWWQSNQLIKTELSCMLPTLSLLCGSHFRWPKPTSGENGKTSGMAAVPIGRSAVPAATSHVSVLFADGSCY